MGIKPGRSTKNKPRDVLYAKAMSFDFDPWLEMLQLAKDSKTPEEKFYRLEAIMPYIKPKLRSMDVKVDAQLTTGHTELVKLLTDVMMDKAKK